MPLNSKNYLDFTGLQQYDTKIKNYIDTEDAKSIKFVKLSTDGNNLLLYKDKAASDASAEADADFTIPMGSAALKNLIKNLGTAVGATYTETPEGFSVTFTGDISSNTNVVAAVQAINDHIGVLGSLTTTTKTSIVAAINELVSAIAGLDVAEFALTENNNDVISIYGIKEEDGKIAKGTSKVDLAKVAKTGAAVDVSYTPANGSDIAATNVQDAITEVEADYKAAIGAMDVTNLSIASQTGKAIKITGSVKEDDGVIAKGADADITLADVASTGAAADVSTAAITDGAPTDPKTLYAAGSAQGTLEAIARDLNDLTTESAVTVEKLDTATEGYLASYVVKQNGAVKGATIDIPKDFLVKSATVKTVTTADDPYSGAKVGDKYIDFVVNVKEGTATDTHLYIAVNDLVHPLSGSTTTVNNEYELQISVDSTNQISATLNNIYAKKVQFVPTSATTVLTNVTTVEGALNKVDELIQGMDADLDATTDTTITDANKVAVITGVTEVDGKITAVDSIDVDKAGAATEVYNAIGSISEASINGLFS